MPTDLGRREQYLERPLPSSEDAEKLILGAVLLDNGMMAQATDKLSGSDFYSPYHRRIYEAMQTLFAKGTQIDPVTISEVLKKTGSIDSIGGMNRIAQLTFGLPHFADIGEYVLTVKRHSMARNVMTICNLTTADILAQEEDVEEIVGRHESLMQDIQSQQDTKGWQHIATSAYNVMVHQAKIINKEIDAPSISTGLSELDNITEGMHRTDLIVVAGRPSMGKTAFALTLAQNAAANGQGVVAVFSMEMSEEQVSKRFLLMESRVNAHAFKRGYLQQSEKDRLTKALNDFQNRGIYIDDAMAQTPLQLKAKARQLKQRHGRLDLIVIDYLQLMEHHKRSREGRRQEIEAISRDLKAMAKELDVPVVALSQLSRAPELRKPPRPMMSDLRETGAIEQDADGVWFVYRPAYYHETDENKRKAEIIVAKSRNGPTGTANLAWLPEITRFDNLDYDQATF